MHGAEILARFHHGNTEANGWTTDTARSLMGMPLTTSFSVVFSLPSVIPW